MRRKTFSAIGLYLLIFGTFSAEAPLVAQASKADLVAFTDVFTKVSEIQFAQSRVSTIGTMGLPDFSPQGLVIVPDPTSHDVKIFDSEGHLVRVVGRQGKGPGEFGTPVDVAVDDAGNFYVVDVTNVRVTKFDSSGQYLSSFIVLGGYSPRRIEVDPQGNIFLGGLRQLESGGAYIHKYDGEGRYLLHFFPPHRRLYDLSLWVSQGVEFDVDGFGFIYSAQPIAYEIYKYDLSGNVQTMFTRQTSLYTPPMAFPKKLRSEQEIQQWFRSWSYIGPVLVVQDSLVLVSYTLANQDNSVIDIFATDGKLLVGGVDVPYRLMATDRKGLVYFLTGEPPNDYELTGFRIGGSNTGFRRTR